ncbi:carbohydrate ABC transporter permease [Eubacterium sp. am_0171]|uniref:carbohydrate ABC transporter permease n=1 Tax=unclassified Eubacterium (in: firmicutes) TaxID=2624479 RepID=UPI00101F9534|nr:MULTISPECIES: carbohydrate ABC transporter permease [unclassified Eubacterium (in: firmicutes)]MSC83916.1 ABC transporter permease subunit [Eubacterium sp. BIOML-A1]MSD07408.1 ABC transporter permease subunit [Eubacterium sp. BIOML-A2]RYT15233.1 carbohydrate ABC transporter permease [Eubacterium sp. am_0171]
MKKSIGYHIFIWGVTVVLAFLILFPVFWIFTSSITEKELLFTTPVTYFPDSPTLQNYISLFREVDVGGLALNTLIVAVLAIIGSLTVSLLAAYAFARFKFRGASTAYSLLVFSAMLPVIMTLIPMFQTYRTLHLHDTHLGLVILYVSGFIPFTTMSFVTFIQQIPYSLEEAAAVDGANIRIRIFKVLFPLMRPAIATMAIINFINSMNEFMIPLVFTNVKATPLSVGLTLIPRINQYNVPWEKISALASLMLVPIIIFVVFFEKHIIDGLTAGSVKQ